MIITWEGEGGAILLHSLFLSLHPLQTLPPTHLLGVSPAPALVAKAQTVIPATASVM